MRAKRARNLQRARDNSTSNDTKAMIRMNLIRNNAVTTQDINLADRIFGPDVPTLKGKLFG